jgi:hypothetical protein
MGEDPVPDLLGPAALFQDFGALDGVLADLRVALVVEVVQETGDTPDLGIATVLRGVMTHGGLHPEPVLDQVGAFGELVEGRPGVLPAARHGGRV